KGGEPPTHCAVTDQITLRSCAQQVKPLSQKGPWRHIIKNSVFRVGLNKAMNLCFRLFGMALVVSGLHGASVEAPPKRITTVVRADARRGRLVRGALLRSRT